MGGSYNFYITTTTTKTTNFVNSIPIMIETYSYLEGNIPKS